jgi:hypothetical protein
MDEALLQSMLNDPSLSVVVPLVPKLTVAPESGLLLEASTTLPFNVFWANAVTDNMQREKVNRITRFIIKMIE